MDVLAVDIHMIKKIVEHETVVALGMRLGQSHIFVHVEGHHMFERHQPLLMGFDQRLVHADGRRTGWQPQHKWMVGCGPGRIDLANHTVGSPLRQQFVVRFDDYSHTFFIFSV